MLDVGLMCVEGFADDEPAWAALLQMDLVSVVETDEGTGRRGFLFSPQVSFHFDIFTALLNLLYLFFLPIQHVLPCTLAEIYCIMFFLTSFHIPIPRLCHIPLSMSEIVYFCAWMNDDFISERLQKHCRLWNNVRCSQTRTALGENIRQSACINNKSRGKLSAYLSRKLVRTHKICCA